MSRMLMMQMGTLKSLLPRAVNRSKGGAGGTSSKSYSSNAVSLATSATCAQCSRSSSESHPIVITSLLVVLQAVAMSEVGLSRIDQTGADAGAFSGGGVCSVPECLGMLLLDCWFKVAERLDSVCGREGGGTGRGGECVSRCRIPRN
jgi:hypothetical protein